jgi:uncharacterized membrane protein
MKRTIIILALALCLNSCVTTESKTMTPKADATVFQKTVKPLIEQRCVYCHSNSKRSAGLNFQNKSNVLDPTLRFIVAGDPQQSRIYLAVTKPAMHPTVMPGDGWGITAAQTKALFDWIKNGAPWPEGKDGKINRRPYRIDRDDYL